MVHWTGQLVLAILHGPLDWTASPCYITWSAGLDSQSLLYYMVHWTGQPVLAILHGPLDQTATELVLAILHGPLDRTASPCYIT